MDEPIHGLLTWQRYVLAAAVPTLSWGRDLETFTGLPFVPTSRSPTAPVLAVLDDRTVSVDGVAWPRFSSTADLRAWLYLTISDVMIMRGEFTVLHAAAFCHEGSVTLLCGEEWSGKSTMTLAALEAGYEVLGDDQVVLGTEAGSVYALPRPVKFRAAEIGIPPGFPANSVPARLGEESVILLPRGPQGYARCDLPYRLGTLIHLQRHRGAGVEITRPDRFESLQRVLNQTRAYSLRDPLADAARQATRLSRLPSYQVSVGDQETQRALALISALSNAQ